MIEAGANERSKDMVTPRYRRVGKTNSPVWHALSSTLRSPEETYAYDPPGMGCSILPSLHQSMHRTSQSVEKEETQRSMRKSLNETVTPGRTSMKRISPNPPSPSTRSTVSPATEARRASAPRTEDDAAPSEKGKAVPSPSEKMLFRLTLTDPPPRSLERRAQ